MRMRQRVYYNITQVRVISITKILYTYTVMVSSTREIYKRLYNIITELINEFIGKRVSLISIFPLKLYYLRVVFHA